MPAQDEHHEVSVGAMRVVVDVLVVPASHDEDRVGWRVDERGVHFVVADGAGNSGRGALAAARAVAKLDTPGSAELRVTELDAELARIGAEAAVVFGAITTNDGALTLEGAAAGDVRAWCFLDERWHELTRGVSRKPLVGSGASPWSLGVVGAGAILVATDGLAGLAAPPSSWVPAAPLDSLVQSVRLAGGRLVDDTSLLRVRVG